MCQRSSYENKFQPTEIFFNKHKNYFIDRSGISLRNFYRRTWDGFENRRRRWHWIFTSLVRNSCFILFVCVFFSYGAIRSGYGQHFGPQGGQDSGFPSPRSALGYPFPAMQNSYSSYHLGGYAPPCASPPKDGRLSLILTAKKQQWIIS